MLSLVLVSMRERGTELCQRIINQSVQRWRLKVAGSTGLPWQPGAKAGVAGTRTRDYGF
jgi:hypothetical protein